ncbi:MAG: DUF3795 domain-containing protein [Candidatus Brocadiaceae bacterium]|nr:DUF3795 domain-containing protein [Candidatus Brocadiaceae bacterium]
MTTVPVDKESVAYCGLYCAACGAHVKGRCPGCHDNQKAAWCKIRSCCRENGYATCADCATYADPRECRKFHNVVSRLFGLIFRSDRRACIRRIREIGRAAYAEGMAADGRHAMRRGGQGIML